MANEKSDDTYSKNAMFCLILDLPYPNVWMVKFFAVDGNGKLTNQAHDETSGIPEKLDESILGSHYSGEHIYDVISVLKEKYGKTFKQLFLYDKKILKDSDIESLREDYLAWLDSQTKGE
jgi:hypothetical protein